jgi:hypothetical protein
MKNSIIIFILAVIFMAGSTSCLVAVHGKRRPHGRVKVVVHAPPKDNIQPQSSIVLVVPTPSSAPAQAAN